MVRAPGERGFQRGDDDARQRCDLGLAGGGRVEEGEVGGLGFDAAEGVAGLVDAGGRR